MVSRMFRLQRKDKLSVSVFQRIEQFEVSFENMIMKKKKGKEVKIRRIFEKGK